jgi:hypothetical protein
MDTPTEYPLKSWLEDYRWYCSESHARGPHSASMDIDDFRSYFKRTRNDPFAANYCLERFIPAMQYLESNRDSICFGKFGVSGDDRFMVRRHVIITLYRFYAARPDHAIDDIVPVKDFIKELKDSHEASA